MLKVSDNRRFLVHGDGRPFFYLADTAWEILYRLDREEAEFYLQDRAAKKFTVIQMVGLVEYGFAKPNRYGQIALIDSDPLRPNEEYFAHADWLIACANALGLTVALLPTWGDKWNKAWGAGPEIFTPANARAYGEWLGRRYRNANLIWVLGGDRHILSDEHKEMIRAMAEGLSEGDGGAHLRTFHPPGGHSSAQWMHDEPWLDFNMWQTGHDRNRDTYHAIESDYARTPVRPCLDGEPGYEDHPASFNPANGYLDDYDVRKSAYGAVFAGACGHTYGCHDIWQFLNPAWAPPVTYAHTPWREAIHFPGSGQVGILRSLIESRPYLTRIPAQPLLASDTSIGTDHIQATQDSHGRYALIYSASGRPFRVHLDRLSGEKKTMHWFDPRTGAARFGGDVPRQNVKEFTPPSSGPGNDWVLVLDDASCAFPSPGSSVYSGA
ncbi:hypothetical protein CCAX7_25420 [Capsulimonas corticalis]|uniref:Uncharacterized protein n=1 Tax=Capsulimonas corticalis TaxID=2219043 RepID=A0A402CVS5_9BACT|nr:glycoside hydrolase family 140 protein [Capsulimonas corticalis]BDI30491.1 hypothetical protein CCAX7_25420 [Capsulimonas corticalis]